jgi:hypothetical protein
MSIMALISARGWSVASLALWLVLSSVVSAASNASACCPADTGAVSEKIDASYQTSSHSMFLHDVHQDANTGSQQVSQKGHHHSPQHNHKQVPGSLGDAQLSKDALASEHTYTHNCDEQHQCLCSSAAQPANIAGVVVLGDLAPELFDQSRVRDPVSPPPASPLRPPKLA